MPKALHDKSLEYTFTARYQQRRGPGWPRRACAVVLSLAGLLMLVPHAGAQAAGFLDPDKAFQVSARSSRPGQAEVLVRIAPGYYLYREPLRISAQGARLGAPAIPKGRIKYDENFQKNVETYRNELRIAVPVSAAAASYTLEIVSQGCADAGLCYPPMTSRLTLSANAGAPAPR